MSYVHLNYRLQILKNLKRFLKQKKKNIGGDKKLSHVQEEFAISCSFKSWSDLISVLKNYPIDYRIERILNEFNWLTEYYISKDRLISSDELIKVIERKNVALAGKITEKRRHPLGLRFNKDFNVNSWSELKDLIKTQPYDKRVVDLKLEFHPTSKTQVKYILLEDALNELNQKFLFPANGGDGIFTSRVPLISSKDFISEAKIDVFVLENNEYISIDDFMYFEGYLLGHKDVMFFDEEEINEYEK